MGHNRIKWCGGHFWCKCEACTVLLIKSHVCVATVGHGYLAVPTSRGGDKKQPTKDDSDEEEVGEGRGMLSGVATRHIHHHSLFNP